MYNIKHSSSNILTFNNIDISYGSNKIINNLAIDNIKAGEVISILGRNGVGKSSLVKALLNIINYTGVITYNTQNIKEYDKNYISKIIGYVPQDYRIYTQITVIEAILLSLNINNKKLSISTDDIDTANNLLQVMDISHLSGQYCNSLSGGQSQIVSLAQALVNNPQILILDEPNSALDIHRQIELLAYVYQYAKKHNTIVINILHDLNLAVKYSDTIAVINKGKIYKQGNAKEVINQDILQNIFNIEADIIEHKGNNIIIPLNSIHTND